MARLRSDARALRDGWIEFQDLAEHSRRIVEALYVESARGGEEEQLAELEHACARIRAEIARLSGNRAAEPRARRAVVLWANRRVEAYRSALASGRYTPVDLWTALEALADDRNTLAKLTGDRLTPRMASTELLVGALALREQVRTASSKRPRPGDPRLAYAECALALAELRIWLANVDAASCRILPSSM